jgi:hypothetical protein
MQLHHGHEGRNLFMSLFLGDSVDGEQEAVGVPLGLGLGDDLLDRSIGYELKQLFLALNTKCKDEQRN